MTIPTSIVTKEQVCAALAELRVNRPRALADANIRSLLRQFGGGATNIGNLDPSLYFHVFCAAGGAGSVCAPRFVAILRSVPGAGPREPRDVIEDAPSASQARVRSPLVADLEARLKERAGKPRSKPKYVVNTGNPAHFGDQADDVVRDFPAGERVR